MRQFKALADPHAIAAEMLHSADTLPSCTPLLLAVLQAVVTALPLCQQQRAGRLMAMLCYCTGPYNKGEWTAVEMAALQAVTRDMGEPALAKAVPSRTPGATRNKWHGTHDATPETIVSIREAVIETGEAPHPL